MKLNTLAESISALGAPSVGIAGEARCVITSADGTVRLDTGYQQNLILNQGLDFFGGGKGYDINASCAIGSGNSTPVATQTKLDAFIAIAGGTNTTSDYSYVDDGSGLYKMREQKQYRFTTTIDHNISELGLVSQGGASDYYLTTRVLPKDSLGAPTSLGWKAGETLDIYYKIHKVVDTTDKSYAINVLDGDGGVVPYNAVIRPFAVGKWSNLSAGLDVSIRTSTSTDGLFPTTSETAYGEGYQNAERISYLGLYTNGAYKKQLTISVDLNQLNGDIRKVSSGYQDSFLFYPFQMRLGRVSDDAPLTKTNKDMLTIPLEFSWSRYEGEL